MRRPEFLQTAVGLGPLTTLEVGGPARYFAGCETTEELVRVLQWAAAEAVSIFVLGGGSNILVADDGFDGVVVQQRAADVHIEFVDGTCALLTAEAGMDWDALVCRAVSEGLAGIECLSGIPGLIGAVPIQNVGAYGQEASSTIQSVDVVDMTGGEVRRLTAADCGFGYRTSKFKTDWNTRYVVTSVCFRLSRSQSGTVNYPDLKSALGISQESTASPTLEETRAAVLEVRRSKSMVLSQEDPNTRSAGSFFLNPILSEAELKVMLTRARANDVTEDIPQFKGGEGKIKIPAAWLIEHAGFTRGTVDGRVGLSSRHALALINRGGATAADLIGFASRIRQTVREVFGVTLNPEPILVGFQEDVDALLS